MKRKLYKYKIQISKQIVLKNYSEKKLTVILLFMIISHLYAQKLKATKLTEYRKEHCESCIETISHASNNFFKKINLSLSKMGTSLKIIKWFQFSKNSVYSLRSAIQLENLALMLFNLEVTLYLGGKILELISENVKSSEPIGIFKSRIKKWVPEICPCQLCKTYVNQVGFVN